MQHFWPIIQSHIRAQVDERTWDLFFQHLALRHFDGQQAVFELPDDFFVTWFENNYVDYLADLFQKVTGQAADIRLYARGQSPVTSDMMSFVQPQPPAQPRRPAPMGPPMGQQHFAPYAHAGYGSAEAPPQAGYNPAMFAQSSAPWPQGPMPSYGAMAPTRGPEPRSWAPQMPQPVQAPAPSLHEQIVRAGLNPRYTFEHFVVGPSNQFSYAACSAVGERPARVYNPLFLYGGVGLGKTHLLHAVGIEILRRAPESRVTYVTSEEFMNGLILSLRTKDTNAFRARFRDECDVLLMDDIQFIAGKHSTQEEFFHTFNALHQAGKQIVITSDKMPQELPELEERLRSRFTWGLIADVQPPEIETRIAIIKKKAEAESMLLTDDVAMFLATHIRSNVRELEGSLIKLKASASLFHQEVTIEFARDQLRGVIQERNATITIDRIQKLVANFYNVKIKDMVGKRRHRVVAHPRHVAMYLCRKHTGQSFPEIGKQFGGRDHSTVMNAVRKIEEGLEDDEALRGEVRSLEQSVLC